jgi:hypothetical protein
LLNKYYSESISNRSTLTTNPLIIYVLTATRQAVTHIREPRRFESMYTR